MIKMLSLYYHVSIGKIEEHEEKKYLMVDDCMLNKVLDKIKKIVGIEKFDNTNILIGTDDKLPDDITFRNVVTLMAFNIKDDSNFSPQLFLEEALLEA